MAGFEDDFGEMVGGKGGGDQAPGDLVTNEERASDLLTNEDPAAEFLAREQEELGDLETEIGPLSGYFLISHVMAVKRRDLLSN